MKTHVFRCIAAMLLCFSASVAQTQEYIYKYFSTDFDTTVPDSTIRFFIDTIHNPNNVWQIGHSHKTQLQGEGNVLITDTINPYPPSDTSYFIIEIWNHGFDVANSYGDAFSVTIGYSVSSDSVHDFGAIDFSINHGFSWYKLNQPENDQCWGYGGGLPISGTSSDWRAINLLNGFSYGELCVSGVDTLTSDDIGDTIALRFAFISDSIQNKTAGVLISSIEIVCQIWTGLSTLPPSESRASVSFSAENIYLEIPASSPRSALLILNSNGRTIRNCNLIAGHNVISISQLPAGLYYYILSSQQKEFLSRGKFVKL